MLRFLFDWLRRGFRDAVLGGVSDAATVLQDETLGVGEDGNFTIEQLQADLTSVIGQPSDAPTLPNLRVIDQPAVPLIESNQQPEEEPETTPVSRTRPRTRLRK